MNARSAHARHWIPCFTRRSSTRLLAAAIGWVGITASLPAGTLSATTLPALVPEPARRALEAIGWRPEDLRFDRADMQLYGGGAFRLDLFDAWIDRPFVALEDVERFQESLLNSAGTPSGLATFAGLRLGRGVRRGLLADPALALAEALHPESPLLPALESLWSAAGRALTPAERRRAMTAFASLPRSWERPVAWILLGQAEAYRWREQAMAPVRAPLDQLEADAIRYVLRLDEDPEPALQRAFEEEAARIDLALLQAGATDLLLLLEKAVPALEQALAEGAEVSAISLDTPLGRIAIGSAAEDGHPSLSYLLLIDPAGDDRYHGGAAGLQGAPVSILIDLSGDDLYATADSTRPAFGAGVTGIGILFDRAGDDRYSAAHVALGAGLCGIGVLHDAAGDDAYESITLTQGAGAFGIGILADVAGSDHYHAFQQAQGYGYTLGCGLLVDGSGDDAYTADDTLIRYPSAQSSEHNTSLAQGFAIGKRADYTDGHSLAGGAGFLVDGAGDDVYRCGVFGQGAAYWYGVGVLADRSGSDRYEGVWYVQGAAAHFALGILRDGSGDDVYAATHNMAQGAGHDFSCGVLYDGAGRDLYQAPNLSLGGGNANGFGVFWDRGGDDRYEVEAATTLGRSNVASRGGLRDRMKNLGLFLDTGGRDSYPVDKSFAGNDRLWTQAGTDTEAPLATEAGVGLDMEWATAEP